MLTATPLILASTSPHRKTLLERLGLPFICMAPQVDEAIIAGEGPVPRAARLALAKARAVARHHPAAIVVGSDQVASIGNGSAQRILRKPGDRATCRQQLLEMSGSSAQFDTAVAVICSTGLLTHVDHTLVKFRRLEEREVDSYMDRESAFDCAGGFRCEGLGVTLFESIESRDPTALIGLPLIWLCAAFRDIGVKV